MRRYWGPIKWLGGIAIIAIVFGILFPILTGSIADEGTRNSVLFQAIPFVAFFIAVLLLYILIIVLVALRYNGKMPRRLYRPVELLTVIGILGGVVLLFQSLHFVGYRYGFVMLLGSTLAFILWSHVLPASAKADLPVPRLTTLHHLIGGAAGIAILILLVTSAASANQPQAPYGIRQRVWNSYDEARQAEIARVATSDFTNIELPFLVVFNLLPALLVYFAVRELAAALFSHSTTREVPPIQRASTMGSA